MHFCSPFSSLLVAGQLAAVLAGKVVHDGRFAPDHILRVSVAQVPSACETREDVVINGTSPGPALHLLPGAVTWIRVYNDMTDRNLTMHWHGLSQRMAPFADGTPGITQWPVPPGHFFDYEIFTEVEDAGTYFYHSHVDMQALSCAGPLIVDDCGTSHLDYDDERILLFQDHFLKTDGEMMQGLTANPFTWTGETRGIILNGRGVAVNHTAVAGLPGDASGHFGSLRWDSLHKFGEKKESDDQIKFPDGCTLPVIDVKPGKTYRFRFIGATGLSILMLGFEGHSNLTIVQVDGNEYNVPVITDYLLLGAGQRFDVLFRTKTMDELLRDGGKTTYFLQFETRDRPDPYRGYAVLRYDLAAQTPASPSAPVLTLPQNITDWMEYLFQPMFPERNRAPTAAEVTRRVILDVQEKIDDKSGRLTPVLVDIYRRGPAAMPNYAAALANYGWDPANKLFPARVGEVLEIVVQNHGSQFAPVAGIVESHPFHAHGQHYYDMGSGPGLYDPEANEARLRGLNYRPVKRDTTMLFRFQGNVEPGEPAGWRAWRMRMEQPGVWMIHCHVLAHMIMGMQAIFVVGDAQQIIKIPVPLSQDYLVYGGDVYGSATHAPSVYHYFNGTRECGTLESLWKEHRGGDRESAEKGDRESAQKEDRGPAQKEDRRPVQKEDRRPAQKENGGPARKENGGPAQKENGGPPQKDEGARPQLV